MLPEPGEYNVAWARCILLRLSAQTSWSGLLNLSHRYILIIWRTEEARSRARSWLTGCRTSPYSVTASARAFTSRRRGARCGARTHPAARIGFFTSTLLRAFPVFPKAWRQSRLLSRSNARGLGRSWMMNMAVKIFFAASSGHAISQGKSASYCKRAGSPI